MAHRQVETTSIHASTYHTGWIRISPDSPWEIVAHNKTTDDMSAVEVGETVLPCTYLDLATQIHMQRSAAKHHPRSHLIRWNRNVHFHDNLKLHVPSSEKGILVLFEAMASEGVAVALSSHPAYQRGGTIEVIFGALGNTKITIMKRSNVANNSTQPSSAGVALISTPCRVCQEGTWASFWVGMWKGKVYAGIGSAPGQKCLAILDPEAFDHSSSSSHNNKPQEEDASIEKNEEGAAYNDTVSKDDAAIQAAGESTGSVTDKNAEIQHVGLGNAAQPGRSVKIRNLQVAQVPSFVAELLETTPDKMDVLMDQDEINDEALKAYQEQCRKARARAEKFGVPYKEPDLAAVVPWSQARKLRANPQKGFITGIDVTDPEELSRQDARKSRFGVVAGMKRDLETADNEEAEKAGGEDPEAAQNMENILDEESIPIIQAWDNEELVRFQRADPPPSLWVIPPVGETERDEPSDEFAMETDKPALTPEKIHLFSIDWSAFKQIRSEDLMAYFTIYGPSYVEWLSDLSCNIQFEDKFSAVRALKAMAQDIPSPPPSQLNDGDDEYRPPDFGAMGWKLGRKMVRKIKNDRFGRRGTTARVLMRPATTLDILVERPSTWPEPPPGFSTKRILGPGSDYNTVNDDDIDENDDEQNDGPRKKRRRPNYERESSKNSTVENKGGRTKGNKKGSTGKRRNRAEDSPPSQPSAADRLYQGLSSGRAGFTMEEMEAMRASKKNASSK